MLSNYKKRTISILAGLALVASACSGGQSGGSDLDARDDSGAAGNSRVEAAALVLRDDALDLPSTEAVSDANGLIQRELAAGLAVLVGPHGAADVSDYLELDAERLSTFPQVDGIPIQRRDYSFYLIRDPEQLVASARLAIRGEIVGFGRPKFNSDTGGYWTPGLHEEAGVVDIANEVWREVQVRVTEVLGDALDTGVQSGDTVVFISRGGQIRVQLADVAVTPGNRAVPEGEHPHQIAPSRSFVVQSNPPVDLVKGEDVVILLDWNKFKGLYDGSYGYRFELMPTNETLYKYVINGDMAVNVGDPKGPLTVTFDALRKLIDTRIGTAAGELPRPGVIAADPHRPVDPAEGSFPDDVDEPDHSHGE